MADELVWDVFTHPSGAALEASVAAAVKDFRTRHRYEPAAVWLSPGLPEIVVDGLEVKRGRHMSPLYVYLEVPGGRQAELPAVDDLADDIVDEPVEPKQLVLF